MTEDQLRHLRPDLLSDHADALRGDPPPPALDWPDATFVIAGIAALVWCGGLLVAGAVFGWWP
jgi:hypothetical protein